MRTLLEPIRPGLILAVTALILGALWAAALAVFHEPLHNRFEQQEQARQVGPGSTPEHGHPSAAPHRHDAHASRTGPAAFAGLHDIVPPASAHEDDAKEATAPHVQQPSPSHPHVHSGSLAGDAMQRLLRGHVHWMGLGTLAAALLLILAFTSLKPMWKKLLGWAFGLGALAYPPAWIIMGFRTVEMGPQAAEASIMWLFGPAVGLLLASMAAAGGVLLIEALGWQHKGICGRIFEEQTDATLRTDTKNRAP